MASESRDATPAPAAVTKKHTTESLAANKRPRSRDSVDSLYAPLSFATRSGACALRAEIKYVQGREDARAAYDTIISAAGAAHLRHEALGPFDASGDLIGLWINVEYPCPDQPCLEVFLEQLHAAGFRPTVIYRGKDGSSAGPSVVHEHVITNFSCAVTVFVGREPHLKGRWNQS
jgi:hypothetical protein